ncbi:MAG: T9SS type A sorting domain-containing protein [Bacteroidota bacterium]
MKNSETSLFKNHGFTFLLAILYMLIPSITWSSAANSPAPNAIVLTDLSGNIWVETDLNSTFNGESGPSGVLISLFNNDVDTLVAQTTSIDGKYQFNNLQAGKYYMRIDQSAFGVGGPLTGLQSCPGLNDADDMVDNDDNGSDNTPNDVRCSPFTLSNIDPMTNVSIEYIDFCFYAGCEQENPLAFPACEDIMVDNILCDMTILDNLCALMPSDSSAGNQPSPLCNDINSPKNISWLAFVAGEGNYVISITPMDCQMGGLGPEGIQVGIYTDCSFTETVFCSQTCTTNPISIDGSVLNAGQVYYLYINGCNGNVCSYEIDVNGNPTIPSLEPNAVCIFSDGNFQCQDIEYCLNDDIIFQAQGAPELGQFTWTISTVSGALYQGDTVVNTTANELVLNIPTEGTYNICITEASNGCIDQDWSGIVCRQVTTSVAVEMPMDEDFGEFFVCEGEFEQFTVNEFAAEDPNGDGDPGWNAPVPEYMLGLNEGTVFIEGCSYEQQFTISELLPTPTEDVTVTICDDELPIQIDAISISQFTFAASLVLTVDNYLLINDTDVNGCDSTINLTVERLLVFEGSIEEPICAPDGFFLRFTYFPDLSTDSEFFTYIWRDPAGNILPNGPDPFLVVAPFESGSGIYSLEIIVEKNGKACSFFYTTEIDIASNIPPTPEVVGPDMVCEGDSSSVYMADMIGDALSVMWSFPNDAASATLSGNFDEVLTIDWTGSNGGNIVAVTQNACGQSNPSTFEVTIIPKPTPNFTLDTSICVNNPTLIEFLGSNFNVATYNWDFDGATINSGIGMGPYEVVWDGPGDKFISLSTIDLNGCISNTTTKSIPVKFPLEPTEVTCVPGVGEVLFTWEIPLNVSGFEVNVISGQTGGVFTANSFSISGLDEEEEVTIELLTMPVDPICGEFVSTFISCTSLNCIPPEIELSADQNACADDNTITIDATITSGETGSGMFSGPGIIDAINGVFDPGTANIGINTILYTFTSDVADCVGSKIISIEVIDVPTSSFIQDKDTMCISDELNLEYNGTTNADFFLWNFDGGIGSGQLTNQDVIFDSPGLKNLSLQVTKDGCDSEVFTSTVLVEPELGDLTIVCDTAGIDFLQFSWNEVEGVSIFRVQIDNNLPFFSTDTSIIIDNLEEDQTVTISVSSLSTSICPEPNASLSCTTLVTVNTEDAGLSKIKVYPNPVMNRLNVKNPEHLNLSYNILSTLGQSIKKGSVVDEFIDMSNLPPGIYMLRVQEFDSKQISDFRIIKG